MGIKLSVSSDLKKCVIIPSTFHTFFTIPTLESGMDPVRDFLNHWRTHYSVIVFSVVIHVGRLGQQRFYLS